MSIQINITYMNDIGMKIKRMRKAVGLTQAQLGKKVGVSAVTIGHWENNRNEFTARNLLTLCMVLKCKPSDVVGDNYFSNDEILDAQANLVRDAFISSQPETQSIIKKIFGIEDDPENN